MSVILQYFGQFLIANRRIRVLRLQGKFPTNGKSRVSEYELKTVRTIDFIKFILIVSSLYFLSESHSSLIQELYVVHSMILQILLKIYQFYLFFL